MEESMTAFCKSLASFCNHLQTNCDALKQAVERRPIPLGSAASTFIQCLNRRVTSAGEDLDLLDTMSFGTVSFEELLGHCNEVYKQNQNDIAELEDRLKYFGYSGHVDVDEENEVDALSMPVDFDSKFPAERINSSSPISKSTSDADSIKKRIKGDSLYDDSFSLKSLGISEASLATLASANKTNVKEHLEPLESVLPSSRTIDDAGDLNQSSAEIPEPVMKISEDDYQSLPSHLRNLASWEDLLAAVEKMNSSMADKVKKSGINFFLRNELGSIGLGPKERCFLLQLIHLNRLVVETVDGSIAYRVLS